MPRGWGSKVKVGQFAIFRFKAFHDQENPRSMVRVLDATTSLFKNHKSKIPIAWLHNGDECGWFLCPKIQLRPATKKEILAWQLDQL